MQLMHEGDRWKLTVPPQLAYGSKVRLAVPNRVEKGGAIHAWRGVQGAGDKIPPDATLVFDLQVGGFTIARAFAIEPVPGGARARTR
jgi:hypothetical protein